MQKSSGGSSLNTVYTDLLSIYEKKEENLKAAENVICIY